MNLDLDKLVGSQRSYQLNIRDTLDIIKSSDDIDGMLKKIVLFCKYAFSVNGNQRKKYLCLFLIRDIFENIPSDNFEKMLQGNIAQKLLKAISMEHTGNFKQSRQRDQQNQEYSERLVLFGVQTIVFWTKKNTTGKSAFKQVYQELKKIKVPMPKSFKYYNPQHLLQLWIEKAQSIDQNKKKLLLSPTLSQLTQKFNTAKAIIEGKLNQSLINQDQISLRQIQKQTKQFLLNFFNRLKQIQDDTSTDRNSVIIYYHIMNQFYKKISNRQYIPINQMIAITRETFQGSYNSQLSSVNKMDIISLAGINKYNTLAIFERIHKKIQEQQKLLPPCQISIQIQDLQKRKSDKSRLSM